MPHIDHEDAAFCALYDTFRRADDALSNHDPANVSGLITAAFAEFTNDGLHRPTHPSNLTDTDPLDNPVLALNVAVREQLDKATSLDESLRLSRARGHLQEAVDCL